MALLGRPFVHPIFDYLLIGGGLSLAVTAAVVYGPRGRNLIGYQMLPWFVLVSAAAHFAASTVRLYTKPDTFRRLPFLTMVFPLVSLAVLTVCMFQAGRLGPHLQSLYLTWSPYHYAAQAYGIAVVYSFRSGCALSGPNKNLLWWVAMLPFFYNFATAPDVGLHWLLPAGVFESAAGRQCLVVAHYVLFALAFATPVWLFVKVWRSTGGPMPLISVLAVLTNGVWFFALPPLDAFVYATLFHGIQYLAISIIFHVKEQLARPDNRRGVAYHVVWFYGASLVLAYALFSCLPLAFVFAGFGPVESVLLVVAAINIHHFIVDQYIWRLKKGDSNVRVVGSRVPVPA